MATKYAFTQGLRELRFHLCPQASASDATRFVAWQQIRQIQLMTICRAFLKRAYPTMKHHNPNTPILIRECTGVEPKIWARYGQHLE